MNDPRLLDPWDDARAIAERLRTPGATLTIVIGAEAWCGRCRRLKPLFEAAAARAAEPDAWLWLDLEEHAEFIGSYVPDDLPMLLQWRAGVCLRASLLPREPADAAGELAWQDVAVPVDLPDLWAAFLRGPG